MTGEPFTRMGNHISGPHNVTAEGNKYILIVSEYFTKWVEAYPIRDMEAKTIAQILVKEFISRVEVPMIIHSLNHMTYQVEMNEKEVKIIPQDLLKPFEA